VIPRLVSTVEKPLTAVDYIAALEQCVTPAEVSVFAELAPAAVRHDERFTKAVAGRLGALKKRQAAA